MNIEEIIKTMLLIGSDLPAYKALLDQVVAAFSEDDQALLQQTYADARKRSDAAHEAAQSL